MEAYNWINENMCNIETISDYIMELNEYPIEVIHYIHKNWIHISNKNNGTYKKTPVKPLPKMSDKILKDFNDTYSAQTIATLYPCYYAKYKKTDE